MSWTVYDDCSFCDYCEVCLWQWGSPCPLLEMGNAQLRSWGRRSSSTKKMKMGGTDQTPIPFVVVVDLPHVVVLGGAAAGDAGGGDYYCCGAAESHCPFFLESETKYGSSFST